MRDRSIDEFESIFEQAAIPVLHIENVALHRVSVVVKGGPLDESVHKLASYLKARFGSTIQVHWPKGGAIEGFRKAADSYDVSMVDRGFSSTAELVGQVSIRRSQLVLLPVPDAEAERLVDIDAMVEGVRPPVLLVRHPIDDPASVFGRILHCLTGNFKQTQNFSYSFTLAEEDGLLDLLHVVDRSDLDDVCEALQVSSEIAMEEGDELLKNLAQYGERFLKGVVAAGRDRPFDVHYHMEIGHVVAAVRARLVRNDYGLVVVGSHREGHSEVAAVDYQLMHQIRNAPVLAL